MDIYLNFNNGEDSLRLPVLPPSISFSKTNGNTTVNINEIGDINLIGKTGLGEITIESFFPSQEYSFCTHTGFPTAQECISLIEKWMQSGKPVRLIITETNLNYAMAIETFTCGESDGSGDINFTLVLKEYRFIKTTTSNKTQTKNGTTITKKSTKRETKSVGTKYTVQKGDTLWTISKRFTGNGANWEAIAKANNITDPYKLPIGKVLTI